MNRWKITCPDGLGISTKVIAPDGREVGGIREVRIVISAGELATAQLIVDAVMVEAGFSDEAVTAKLTEE